MTLVDIIYPLPSRVHEVFIPVPTLPSSEKFCYFSGSVTLVTVDKPLILVPSTVNDTPDYPVSKMKTEAGLFVLPLYPLYLPNSVTSNKSPQLCL